ncbi:hypothetical protein H5410_030912 [Solanum commersonii]|uniref:Uncharacterized protein n=1 Tax=Solanum commersonii TaxID=4109 RepID=A0A9J5YKQ8_SOLCO|nr:hypothetical protein H5410_030912 [Solanum commersonii]
MHQAPLLSLPMVAPRDPLSPCQKNGSTPSVNALSIIQSSQIDLESSILRGFSSPFIISPLVLAFQEFKI